MVQAPVPTPTRPLYPAIPWETSATATCYCCGTRLPAQYMLWLDGLVPDAYMALCGVCSRDAEAEQEGAAAPLERYTRFHRGAQGMPGSVRS